MLMLHSTIAAPAVDAKSGAIKAIWVIPSGTRRTQSGIIAHPQSAAAFRPVYRNRILLGADEKTEMGDMEAACPRFGDVRKQM
ncbi:hypothetical protein J6590_056720 [Homalodisca vitripennis]|nr:hypothetical protein J6590_056720 [Homalodisca vitripennis]